MVDTDSSGSEGERTVPKSVSRKRSRSSVNSAPEKEKVQKLSPSTSNVSMDSPDSPGSTGTQNNNQPQICKGSTCCFFGSPQSEGYCSVCFKDILKKRQQTNNNTTSLSSNASTLREIKDTITANSSNNKINLNSTSSTPTPPLPNNTSSLSQSDTTNNLKRRNEDSTSSINNDGQSTPIPINSTNLSTPTKTTDLLQSDKNSVSSSPNKKKKRRCVVCNKKLGIATGFECRCGGLYCTTHRYEDQHSCTFDYKSDGRNKLRKDNPVVCDEKIEKI